MSGIQLVASGRPVEDRRKVKPIVKTMVELRRQLYEMIVYVTYHHKFFVLTRHGKPVAMLIPYSKKWEQEEIDMSLNDDGSIKVDLAFLKGKTND